MPLYGFAYKASALAELRAIPRKFREQIKKRIDALAKEPYPQGCKKLEGMQDEVGRSIYRIRSGDYRVLYVVTENPATITVLAIAHRREVYR